MSNLPAQVAAACPGQHPVAAWEISVFNSVLKLSDR